MFKSIFFFSRIISTFEEYFFNGTSGFSTIICSRIIPKLVVPPVAKIENFERFFFVERPIPTGTYKEHKIINFRFLYPQPYVYKMSNGFRTHLSLQQNGFRTFRVDLGLFVYPK